MFTLRDYQPPLVCATVEHMNEGGAPCLVSPTGSGKTVMLAEITRLYREWGYQVILAAHRNEIIKQLAASCRKHCNEPVGFYTAKRMTEDRGIMVTMMPTLARRREAVSTFRGRVLLLDECFPAGTLVDGRPIEDVCVGDCVTAWDGRRLQKRKVTGLHRNPAPPLMVRLRTTAGTEITCTAGHPVWADDDWRPAIALEPGMAMMQLTATPTTDAFSQLLRHVRSAGPRHQGMQGAGTEEGMGLLQQRMLLSLPSMEQLYYDGGNQPQARFRQNDCLQSNETRRSQAKGITTLERDWPSAAHSRREWQAGDSGGSVDGSIIGLGNAGYCQNWLCSIAGSEVPDSLQNRRWPYEPQDCRRDRWPLALRDRATGARQKENSFSAVTWLESIEILERTSDRRSHELCPDGFVYNLEVEQDHCYFANGVLVHNCHHIQAKTYQEIIVAMQPAFFAGASATPITPTGAGLGKFGITKLILGPQPKQLMDDGSLCKYKMFGGDDAVVDTEGVATRGGDYKKEEIEERIVKVQGDFLRDLLHFNPKLHPTITVTISVEHAHRIAEEYKAHGISAEVVIGTTSDRDRDYAFERFTAGDLKVIVSVALIDEGLDLPAATCLQLIRPTRSLRLWKQLIGRVLRTDPSNPDKVALIIDHGNCWRNLPLPHEPIDWTLEGKVKFKKARLHLNVDKEVVEKPEKPERALVAQGDRKEMRELSIEDLYEQRIQKRVKAAKKNLYLVEAKHFNPAILWPFANSPEGLTGEQRRRVERCLGLPYGHCGEVPSGQCY
jgi:superfamily II DNA or RNA helicase